MPSEQSNPRASLGPERNTGAERKRLEAPATRCYPRYSESGEILDRGRSAVLLDRFDPIIAGSRRRIHFAPSNDLAVLRFEDKMRLTGRRVLAFVIGVVGSVLADGFD